MQPDSFGIFFKLKNGPFLFKVLGLTVGVVAIALYNLYAHALITDDQLIGFSVGGVVMLDLIFFVLFLLPYLSYKKFLQTSSSMSDDWTTFIVGRSKDFLSANRYIKVSVSLRPAPTVTQEHRDAINQFLLMWQAEGESMHKGRWKKGRPDKFKVSQNMISGHVAIAGGMNLLMRKWFVELPALLKAVEDQVEASLDYGSETSFEDDIAPTAIDEAFEREMDRKSKQS